MIQFNDQDGSVELKDGNLSRIKWGRNEGHVSKFEIKFLSTQRLLPRGTDKKIKVLNTCLKNLTWRWIFEAEVMQSIREMYEIRTIERVQV